MSCRLKTTDVWHVQFQHVMSLLLVGLVVSLSGCTTPQGGSMKVIQAPDGDLSKYKTIDVAVTSKDADFSPKDVALLKGFIVEDLRKSGRYETVYAGTSSTERPVDLKLSVLVEFVIGPNTHKVQSIEGRVALTDQSEGKTLGAASIKGYSEWALFGGHMTNAMAEFSKQIVNFSKPRLIDHQETEPVQRSTTTSFSPPR